MNKKMKTLSLVICIANASACVMTQESVTTDYNRGYVMYTYDASHAYPNPYYESYPNEYISYPYPNYPYENPRREAVEVPQSYHVNNFSNPVSFKNRDRHWVNSQNPNKYTIEIADDEKASQVAQKLYKAPKNERMAQIKYQNNGKTHYKGVYGSFDDEQSAKNAINNLPAGLKEDARVKPWGAMQNAD